MHACSYMPMAAYICPFNAVTMHVVSYAYSSYVAIYIANYIVVYRIAGKL